jgi:hypothetical protein
MNRNKIITLTAATLIFLTTGFTKLNRRQKDRTMQLLYMKFGSPIPDILHLEESLRIAPSVRTEQLYSLGGSKEKKVGILTILFCT